MAGPWLTEDGETIFLNDLTDYIEAGEFVVVDGSVMWWDGAVLHPVTLRGWWDGALEQPVTLKGAWNGSGYDPIIGGG